MIEADAAKTALELTFLLFKNKPIAIGSMEAKNRAAGRKPPSGVKNSARIMAGS